MRQIAETEIDAKLAEVEKAFEDTQKRLAGLEQEIAKGKEELFRLQGDYRTWTSFRDMMKKESGVIDPSPSQPEGTKV